MKFPEWYATAIAQANARVEAGDMTQSEAITVIRDQLRGNQDDPLVLGLFSSFARKSLEDFQRSRRGEPAGPGRAPAVQIQSELFPDLPVQLLVQPGRKKSLILFTAHDWDAARAMVTARCDNAKKGAEEDLAQFEEAYARVRPLLSGELTTAEVADQLRAAEALAAT